MDNPAAPQVLTFYKISAWRSQGAVSASITSAVSLYTPEWVLEKFHSPGLSWKHVRWLRALPSLLGRFMHHGFQRTVEFWITASCLSQGSFQAIPSTTKKPCSLQHKHGKALKGAGRVECTRESFTLPADIIIREHKDCL